MGDEAEKPKAVPGYLSLRGGDGESPTTVRDVRAGLARPASYLAEDTEEDTSPVLREIREFETVMTRRRFYLVNLGYGALGVLLGLFFPVLVLLVAPHLTLGVH